MPKKGSKRKKTRTHVKPSIATTDPNATKVPKSFVVKSGTVGGSVAALTRDVRKVLEPNTGSRIRERKANRLRDFVSMSGPLGVTHLLVFSQPPATNLTPLVSIPIVSDPNKSAKEAAEDRAERSLIEGTTTLNLRLIRLPRGPTLSFKVLRYSLASDVLRMARRPRSTGREFAEGPMLILSGFGGEDKQLKLMTTVFQNLFPAIHVQTMPLSSARRVVLLSYNPVTHTIDFRHFVISVRPVGVSRPIRKIIGGSTSNKIQPLANSRKRERSVSVGTEDSFGTGGFGAKGKGIIDLSRAEDISDFVLRHEGMGFVTSDSEMSDMSDNGGGSQSGGNSSGSEEDERRGKVRLAQDYVGRGNRGKGVKGEKRAVRLVELGPRMELGLIKVEEGVGEGEVMFHEMVHKSVTEAVKLAKVHAAKRKLAAERRAAQAVNVAAKKAAKKAARGEVEAAYGEEEKEDGENEEEDEEEDSDAIDSDNSFDYDEAHGLPVGSGSEEDFSDGDEQDEEASGGEEDESRMAVESDADDSNSDEEQDDGEEEEEEGEDEDEENYEDEDDSDTSPVPMTYDEDNAPPAKKRQIQGRPSSSGMGFKHKGFAKQERAPAKGAVGVFHGRPVKETPGDKMEAADREDFGGRGRGRGRGGDRGGRGGDRGRGGRGGSRGGSERGRSGSRGGRGGFEKRGGSSGGRGGRGGGRGRGK